MSEVSALLIGALGGGALGALAAAGEGTIPIHFKLALGAFAALLTVGALGLSAPEPSGSGPARELSEIVGALAVMVESARGAWAALGLVAGASIGAGVVIIGRRSG